MKNTSLILRDVEFCAWVAQAVPGQVLEYHCGYLSLDRTPFGQPLSAEGRAELIRLGSRALQLADQGFVHLVQRRLGPDCFSYLAVMRPRPKGAPLTFATLMSEEAA